MAEVQRDEADRRESRYREQRQRAEFARDAVVTYGRRLDLGGGDRGEFGWGRFQLAPDGYGTSIT
jgi:hypothetical protein